MQATSKAKVRQGNAKAMQGIKVRLWFMVVLVDGYYLLLLLLLLLY